MNNIDAEVLQMKIDGMCTWYPQDLTKDDLIDWAEELADELGNYGDLLCFERKDTSINWSLFYSSACTLRLVVEYFERDEALEDDIVHEGYLANLCSHFGWALLEYSELVKDDDICDTLWNTIEFTNLLFRVLGKPMSKKKFENSIGDE